MERRRWTDDELLAALKKRASELGRVPRKYDMGPSFGTPSAYVYAERFGSWNAALSAVGFPPNAKGVRPRLTEEELLDALKKRASELGRTPRMADMGPSFDTPAAFAYIDKFGSWNAALSAAGLPLNRKGGRYRRWTDSEILDALRSCAEKLGRRPVHSDFVSRDPAEVPSLPLIRQRFGSFKKALEAAGVAGLPDKRLAERKVLLDALPPKPFYLASEVAEAARRASVPYGTLRRALLWSGVSVVKAKTPCFRSVAAVLRDGKVARESLREAMGLRAFAFFEGVLAGRTFQEMGKSAGLSRERVRQILVEGCRRAVAAMRGFPVSPANRRTDERLLEDLRRRASELGRPPRVVEIGPAFGTACVQTYVKRFGSWKNALLAAGFHPVEKTFVLLKPDGFSRGLLLTVLRRFEQAGLAVAALRIGRYPRWVFAELYSRQKEKPFFEAMLDFLASGTVAAVLFRGPGAVSRARALVGLAVNPPRGTIRGDFKRPGSPSWENVVHASDSAEAALREAELFGLASRKEEEEPCSATRGSICSSPALAPTISGTSRALKNPLPGMPSSARPSTPSSPAI